MDERQLTPVALPWRTQVPADRLIWLVLLAVALFAFAFRLFVVLSLHPTCEADEMAADCFRPGADAFYYSAQGQLLAEGELFASPNDLFSAKSNEDLGPGAQHPPLYSTVLGLASAAGFDTQDDHRAVSAAIGAVGVLLIGLVGWRIAGRRTAVVAAVLAGMAPQLWLNDEVAMSESLFVPLVAGVLLAAFVFWERPTTRSALVLGLLIGLAVLTRTEAVGLLVLLVVPLVLVLRLPWRQGLWLVASAASVVVLLVAPWIAFNLARFEEPTLLTSGTGITLLAGNCNLTYEGEEMGAAGYRCAGVLFGELDRDREAGIDPGDESQVDARARDMGVDHASENLGRVPAVMAVRALRTWGLVAADAERSADKLVEQRHETGVDVAHWLHLALIPCSVVGLLVLRRRGITVVPFLALFATATLLAMITFGLTRFRVTADVSMVLLTAVAIDAALRALLPSRPGIDPT